MMSFHDDGRESGRGLPKDWITVTLSGNNELIKQYLGNKFGYKNDLDLCDKCNPLIFKLLTKESTP